MREGKYWITYSRNWTEKNKVALRKRHIYHERVSNRCIGYVVFMN